MTKVFNSAISLLLAGSFFCFGFWGTVARGVEIEGVFVGGMPYAEAEKAVRERMGGAYLPLVVRTPAGEFDATQSLGYSDDLSSLVRNAEKDGKYSVRITRAWVGMEDFLYDVCVKNARDSENATLGFSAEGFTYTAGVLGISCDYAALVREATRALAEGDTSVTLNCREYPPEITEEDLKERTQRLSSFATAFDQTNLPRARNIALAASRISGTVVPPHGEFSFNRTVGERTVENGFGIAAVIQDGEFLPGVGGGVCQASSTLMGAALRAGMKITRSRPHSLSVGYVPPSLDAMVSSDSDFAFENPYDQPVYILAKSAGGEVRFSFYGLPDGRRYEPESVVLLRVAPPEPKMIEGADERVIRPEREGIASESYLLVYEGDTLVSRTRIRRDSYAAVQGIVQRPASGQTADEGQGGAEEPPVPQNENIPEKNGEF